MIDTFETRSVALNDPAIKNKTFTGRAAVFGSRARIGNPFSFGLGFFEVVAPGAFRDSITDATADVLMLADHDPAKPLARMSAGTLHLHEDRVGLAVEAQLLNTSTARDLAENIRGGLVKGMSFSFSVPSGGDTWKRETVSGPDGQPAQVEVRTLRQVTLHEVSTTSNPAYTATTAAIRVARRGAYLRGRLDYLADRFGMRPAAGDDDLETRRARMAVLAGKLGLPLD